jgi:hypothetical protein
MSRAGQRPTCQKPRPNRLDEHPPWPSSPDGNSKESTKSYTPTNSLSGQDYEGDGEEDDSDTDDDSESVSSMVSVLPDDEALLTDNPAADLPEVIANVISFVIKSRDHDRDSLLARRLISRLVKKAGQSPPVQASCFEKLMHPGPPLLEVLVSFSFLACPTLAILSAFIDCSLLPPPTFVALGTPASKTRDHVATPAPDQIFFAT